MEEKTIQYSEEYITIGDEVEHKSTNGSTSTITNTYHANNTFGESEGNEVNIEG
jgi:hypothetical protein